MKIQKQSNLDIHFKNVLIVDDEIECCELIQKLLNKYFPNIEKISIANSLEEASTILENENIELVFLDIQIRNKTIFELLNTIDLSSHQIIYVTGYKEYAFDAIKAGVTDYILKPIKIPEFKSAVEKAFEQLHPSSEEQDDKIKIKVKKGFRFVSLGDIIYIEANGSYCLVKLVGNEEETISMTLKLFESKLDDDRFLRINKSFSINKSHIQSIQRGRYPIITMSDGSSLKASDRKRKLILQYLRNEESIVS